MAEPREFSNLTRHAIFHAVSEIAPKSFHAVLPASGSHKIESFCHDLSELFRRTILENPLIPSEEVHRFYEQATSVDEFTMLIEKKVLMVTEGEIEEEPIHRICWSYYEAERKSDVTYPKWLSQESTYCLWLIFNCVLDKELTTTLPQVTVNEMLQRMLELCGYTWDEKYGYNKEEPLGFPDFLDVITNHFDELKLEMSLTSEVIADMMDEVVHDVLRKGYLTKKGHVRKNYKRRWFVLQRTTLRYYHSREKMQLKVALLLLSFPPLSFPPFPPLSFPLLPSPSLLSPFHLSLLSRSLSFPLPPFLSSSLPPSLPLSLPPSLPPSIPPSLSPSLPPFLPSFPLSIPPSLPSLLSPSLLPSSLLPSFPPLSPPPPPFSLL